MTHAAGPTLHAWRSPRVRLGITSMVLLALLGCGDSHSDNAPPARDTGATAGAPLVRGIAIGLYHDTPKAPYAQQLRELREHGANFTNLVIHWFQSSVHTHDLAPDPERTPKDATVIAALQSARAQGLHVMLMPIPQLRTRATGEWRGKLAPTDLPKWRSAYARFITHYARLAANAGAALFCIGSELVSLEGQRILWASLIEDVRAIFPGALTYSANWDHYAPVAFWDLVDLVGINGYFEIAKDAAPTVARMTERWSAVRVQLESFAHRQKRPLFFTEVGYPSIQGGATWPWHYGREAPLDLGEQARAYDAFIHVWRTPSSVFRGVLFWNWEGAGGPTDTGYTPRGKPAAEHVKAWFGAPGPQMQPRSKTDVGPRSLAQ